MRFFKGLTKRGQSGQSLVILAIGFLALLGFVGIVTDVSVLFIRYNTMRRAVDAAAIAAAGQMRRVADPTPLDGNADDEAISVANLNLAARQFIEVYGLNPKSVLVETCRVQSVPRDSSGNPTDEFGQPLFNSDGTENSLADPETLKSYKQLCTADELKLVRVTAQIDAPTIFLRLLGYPTVTLTESAMSQTAVIDVVLVFDVSESMLNQTTYGDWDTLSPPQGVRYMPPYLKFDDVWPVADDPGTVDCDETRPNPWEYIADHTQAEIAPYISSSVTPDPCGPGHLVSSWDLFRDRTIPFEDDGAGGWQEWVGTHTDTDGNLLSDQDRAQPRTFCQVRAYPNSSTNGKAPVSADLRQEYYAFFESSAWLTANPGEDYSYQFQGNVGGSPPASSASFSGFVPMYNSFACCNDPNGDFLFDDAICQPFKSARDAAGEFLDRLDFLRGDRVAYVTFNRRAYLVDPDGADIYDASGTLVTPGGPQAAMIETQYNLDDPSDPDPTVLLRKGAVETLNDVVGVLAEPSSYVDTDNNGLWDALWDGTQSVGLARTYDLGSDPNNYYSGVDIGEITNHPVNGGCPFDRAVLDTYYLSSASKIMPDLSPRPDTLALLDQIVTVPQWYISGGGSFGRYRSYENRASCAGTNIGGALAASSAALFNEGRREGAVWIMVLLSDGAAGASNPIYDINGSDIAPAYPYAVDGGGHLDPQAGIGGPICTDPFSPNYPCPANTTGGYGFFGLCPYGTSAQPGQILQSSAFPTCSDLQPETRHYCGQVAYIPDTALDEDTSVTGCINYYDVDDYARDWADWVAVADLPNAISGGTTGRVGDQLLPTIFTIGFGLNYNNGQDVGGTPVDCAGNNDCIRGLAAGTPDNSGLRRLRNADYLGEELLRYIADVGDNFQIDNDYWQWHASTQSLYPGSGLTNTCADPHDPTDRIGNCIDTTSSSPDWGTFGACETETATHNGAWNPKTPLQSCGNYYVAASGQQLEDVFNQIASRMFTRLSQ